MKRFLFTIVSPLVIGLAAGVLIPLVQYDRIRMDAEVSHPVKQAALERLPASLAIGGSVGLAVGILGDLVIRRITRRLTAR